MKRILALAVIFFWELPACIAFRQLINRNMDKSTMTHRLSTLSPESLASNGKTGFRTIASVVALSSILIPTSRF